MKYPYYIVPDVEAYRKLAPDSPQAKDLARKIAANIGDYAALRFVLGIDPPEFARFYPDMETTTPSTLDTIDSFLDKFGSNLQPVGYVPEIDEDLTPELPAGDEESRGKKPESKVESQESETSGTTTEKKEQNDLNSETTLSTSVLSQLLKKKKFKEAMALIEAQNLNNRNKSIYFAHQIRFIKKLMAVENYKNRTKG